MIRRRLRRFWTFSQTYGWKRSCYRLGVALLRLLSRGRCRFVVVEIMTASVGQLRLLERLPKALQVRLAGEDDLPQLRRFVIVPERAAERLATGDSCVLALSEGRVLATEWFRMGPSLYQEDARELGATFYVPKGACWLYDGVSGERGKAFGPWGAVMGCLRTYVLERGADTVYLQVGYDNPYSAVCHQSLGFRVMGRFCFLRFGRRRCILYKPLDGGWTRVPGGTFDLPQLEKERRGRFALLYEEKVS